MSNRFLSYLTGLVLLGIAILFALNLTAIFSGKPEGQTYLKYNDVRGMAVGHNQLLYTLNFKQQNDVIDIINEAVLIKEIKPGKRNIPNVEKIVIYQFNNKPELVITPITYVDNNLVFSVPQWNAEGYLIEVSEGRLQQLLTQTYDP